MEPNGTPQPLLHHAHPTVMPEALPERGFHPDAALGLARVYSGRPVDVLTFHNNGMRTGWNASETDLTPAKVASSSFGLLKTLNVDGTVMAQPLIVSGIQMPGGSKRNVLIIATGHNSVYAYDAQSYALLWHVNLGTSQTSVDVGCSDVQPEYGISSTPVILRTGPAAATLYVVAATEPSSYSFHTQLHALSVATGKDLLPPKEITIRKALADGHTIAYDQQSQWNRAGLVLANNALYIAIGSHCDMNMGSVTGWLLHYGKNLSFLNAFNTIQLRAPLQMASIWMSGAAPAVDEAGNILFVTGNGNYSQQNSSKDYGQSIVSVSPDLRTVNGTFTPANFATLNTDDKDFGAGGIMLLPVAAGQKAPPMAVAMGKDPTLYLVNRSALPGLQGPGKSPLQALSQSGGVWGTPAYYGGPTGGRGRVFYQMNGDVLRSFAVNVTTGKLLNVVNGTSNAGWGGSMPIVSSNGRVANTGIVWLIRRGVTLQLEAYDALKLGAPLFASNAGTWRNSFGNAYVTPLEANGRVYVGGYLTVNVFGLTK
jgi:hypothetical protein